MKFTVPGLRVGQIVEGEVVECQSQGHLIINFRGDLIRILNQTSKPLVRGQKIQLRVTAVNPLGFQLWERQPSRLNVSV